MEFSLLFVCLFVVGVAGTAVPLPNRMTEAEIRTESKMCRGGGSEQAAPATERRFRNKAAVPGDVHCFMQAVLWVLYVSIEDRTLAEGLGLPTETSRGCPLLNPFQLVIHLNSWVLRPVARVSLKFKFHRTQHQSLFHSLLHHSHYMFRPYL
jgi:hypothetical protein